MHVILLGRVPLEAVVADEQVPLALSLSHPRPDAPDIAADSVDWVRTGYSEPWFPLLPDSEIARQLEREATALAGLGVTPGPLWVTGPWTTRLPLVFAAAGVEALLLAADQLDVPRCGVVAHLDAVLPVIPVTTPERLSEFDLAADEAVALDVPFAELGATARRLAATPGCDLTTVTRFLAEHRPSGRRRPLIDDWEARLGSDPDRFILHRKLVRLVTRVPERLGAQAELAVLEAERATPFSGGPVEPAHRAIVAARAAIDAERRRGDDWLRVSRLDWDADGAEEVHLELASLSMVVAPHRSAAVPTLDLKDPVWPASSVPGEPGWTLCRFTDDGEDLEATPIELTVMRASEVKGGKAELELSGALGDGTVTVEMAVSTARLDVTYRLDEASPGQIGPEMKLAFGSSIEVRVDGSAWTGVTGPRALTGHKFRITDGANQVVLTSLIPCAVFLRPGIDGGGLVAWAHWGTSGSDTHALTIDLAPTKT
ncbi:MAG: hypothetical protein ACFCVC_18930 [Acidimicrobiia bacterium]